ncbi:hypothetical protein PIB30_085763 [Stylosanthes scabra]|uniref:RNase H type-1 domain-containing protein n=1 Tax=Stylosanthes scabra TaxID=79078 RepID=A0ABU6TSF6_9FABA|nr:hypothetical protein [Stylosanthes scabra]
MFYAVRIEKNPATTNQSGMGIGDGEACGRTEVAAEVSLRDWIIDILKKVGRDGGASTNQGVSHNLPLRNNSANSWNPPPSGLFKINFDAACNTDGKRGVGVAIMNEEGVVVAAAMVEAQNDLSVMEAEALGAFLGLEFALHGCLFLCSH